VNGCIVNPNVFRPGRRKCGREFFTYSANRKNGTDLFPGAARTTSQSILQGARNLPEGTGLAADRHVRLIVSKTDAAHAKKVPMQRRGTRGNNANPTFPPHPTHQKQLTFGPY
jgi:hypothetical protein